MSANPFKAIQKYFRKKQELKYFKQASTTEVFTTIYEENKWGDDESRSGKGSNLERTEAIRKRLPEILSEFNIRTLLDIPCGDFYWMSKIDPELDHYYGADIVESMIEENKRNYARENRTFQQLNLLCDSLPKTDAILCRECLVHFSFDDIFKAIDNIKSTGAEYLLATHFPEIQNNKDIVTGKHRSLNLEKAPFNWPDPLTQILELNAGARRGNKYLSVWKISDLPSRD